MGLPHQLRSSDITAAILIVMTQDQIHAGSVCLDTSADSFIIKPFDSNELTAGIQSAMLSTSDRASAMIYHGGIEIDVATNQVWRHQELVILKMKFGILPILIEHASAIQTKEHLEKALHGWGEKN